MSLTTPVSVQKLQTALHAKAKESPDFRFYALYDKVYRRDVLAFAYALLQSQWRSGRSGRPDVRGHRGVRGGAVAGRTGGGTEKPNVSTAVRCGGCISPSRMASRGRWGCRRSGIGSCKRRRCWCSNRSSRPICSRNSTPIAQDRSALDAVRHVHKLLNTGHGEIVDADLSGYFDCIPHAELMKSVARRVVDGAMLHLIKMWLEAPVEETDERGNKHRTTRNRDEGRGTPQGAPISPLLSNLYMRRFVLGWKTAGTREASESVHRQLCR